MNYNKFQIPIIIAKMKKIDVGNLVKVQSFDIPFDSHMWLIILHRNPLCADLCLWVKFTEYDLMYVCSLPFLKLNSNDHKRLIAYNPKLPENVFDEDSKNTLYDGIL